MAGWLKRVDGLGLESFKIRQKVEETKQPWLDHVPISKVSFNSKEEEEGLTDKLKSSFNDFLLVFLGKVFGAFCYRPMPPMLGDGQSLDLFKLYLNVREKGGFEKVSKNGQWDSVAKECGFDSSVGSAVKLVYVKYLDTLPISLERVDKGEDSKSGSDFLSVLLMNLESDLKGFLSGISDKKKKDGEYMNVELMKTGLDFECDGKLSRADEHGCFVKLNVDFDNVEKKSFVEDGGKGGVESVNGKGNADDEDRIFVDNVDQGRRYEDGDTVSDSNGEKEDVSSRKRKRECYMGMLSWINRIARDPCDPAIGYLPDRSKWKYCATDQVWKQVLLVREAMLSTRNTESSDQQATLQKKQKVHPNLYDDQSSSERQRFSQRLQSAKDPSKKSMPRISSESSSSGMQSDWDLVETQSDSSADSDADFAGSRRYRKKRIPVGPCFQADVPEWTGETCESDSKWLGTRFWPLERVEQSRNLIERERIGKGRQDSCGCQFPGSYECVRFHVSEKRMRLKLELGPAFYRWKFDNMGEDVALSWTKEEEKKFHDTVKLNPLSLGKFFWQEVVNSFRRKRRESLVSYYFNVFLLQRRGHQNRVTPNNINSDDDESESKYGITPGSIFCSPKKPHSE